MMILQAFARTHDTEMHDCCRYPACLAGSGAPPGQAERQGGGSHGGEAQRTEDGPPEPTLSSYP